ncbi:hypothetical protein ACIQI7_04500 [Kitasatospora sp. NPDC092039]|uniref:hypothetical protein n=1 Tax=Kitasatospora sp. NPDC092039 TaxID=3364086 RepID=UPI0037FC06A8
MTDTPDTGPGLLRTLADAQRAHWQQTYTADPGVYGERPSAPAEYAAEAFAAAGAREVLARGAGHGRDAPRFARAGFRVPAADFSPTGLHRLSDAAAVDALAEGRRLTDVHPFEKGELPRRLWRITQETPR